MGKNPAFQFYPGDWVKDPELRSCSLSARGVWLDILCLMSQCKPMGILGTDGLPWDVTRLSRALGGDKEVILALNELISNGVLKKNKDDFFWSRILFEQGVERKKWVKRQQKCRKDNKEMSRQCHANVTPMSRPSSSSSSLKSNIVGSKDPTHPPDGGKSSYPEGFEKVWNAGLDKSCGKKNGLKSYGRRKDKPTDDKCVEIIHDQLTWDKSKAGYVPMFTTWFNQGRWDAEPPHCRGPTTKSGSDEWLEEIKKLEKGEK